MALTRPVVLLFQTSKTVSVTPGTPKLNCCYVGPCFSLQDYPADKTAISTDDFIAATKTKDSACSDVDGESTGRPADNADFLVLAEAPGHSGVQGNLDAASVDAVFDEALIELDQGIDITGVGPAILVENDYKVYSASADFVTNMVVAGDRLVLTKNAPNADDDHTIKKIVHEVEDLNTLVLTENFTAAELVLIGTADINWRVEHKLDDQRIDATKYVVVLGNQITIKTGVEGIVLAYTNDSAVAAVDYPVNYAEIYIGSRLLRTDLQAVGTVSSPAEILSALGRVDERNPLAVACSVGLSNTITPVQYFGIPTDNLAGHQTAQVNTSARSDMYAIVPVTDSITGADWVAVIGSWKTQADQLDDPEKAKYRVILGSYDILPTDKSSAPASDKGSTMSDPVNTTLFDVLVDPADATDFLTDAISSSHLLDLAHGHTDVTTMAIGETIFFTGAGGGAEYGGAKTLLGVIGSKRLRVAAAKKFASYQTADPGNYAVRDKILKSEGATPLVDKTACTWGTNGDAPARARITKVGAFANVAIGDVVHVTGDAVTASHNDGWLVITTFGGASDDYIDIECAEVTGGTVEVQVYRPIASSALASVTVATRKITASGGTDFANVAIGDIVFVLQSPGTASGNVCMWIVENKLADDEIIVGDPAGVIEADVNLSNVCVFRSKSSNPSAALTARRRLTRLQDATASFLTGVKPGEDIEIPYPASAGAGYKWDTTTTKWPIKTIVNDNILDADLETLEELAPKDYIGIDTDYGFNGDCPYRVSVDLNKDSQVDELNTITTGLKHFRVVMVWPNECTVTDLKNELTDIQGRHHGQYLAATVGGMIAGLPPHQGFTFITAGGISQIYNSNFYFGDDHITELCEGGWYVFLQDSEVSPPYCALECTTDTAAYETGELMYVKDFDYISLGFKDIMQGFLGRYNLLPETLGILNDAFYVQADAFKGDRHERIGAPLISAEIIILEKHGTEKGRAELYAEVEIPEVLNKIGMHLIA